MKTTLGTLLAVGLSAGCMINGKPLFWRRHQQQREPQLRARWRWRWRWRPGPAAPDGRLAYIQYCLGESGSAWAMWQGDIDVLDRAKLATELRATPAASAKMIVRLALGSVDARLPAHAANIKQLVASDPAYGTLFAVAATTRKQWHAAAPKRTEILGLLAALDDARVAKSKQAAKRCDTDLWAHFTQAVAALPVGIFGRNKGNPKDATRFGREAMALAVQDPDVYLSANALVTCHHEVSCPAGTEAARVSDGDPGDEP